MHRCRLMVVSSLVFLGLWQYARADDRPGTAETVAFAEGFQKIIKQAEPSIACVLVSRSEAYREQFNDAPPPGDPGRLGPFPPRNVSATAASRVMQAKDLRRLDLADPENIPETYGSGVIIDEKGLVLTNYHVIRDATKIFVRLPGNKASYADIHAADPRSDLAVLRLLDETILPVPALPFGDGGNVEKGQWILSLAHPFAAGFRDGSPSASWGILSNVRRRAPGIVKEEDRRKTLHHYGTLLQTDARLNFGCSGGALLNLKGELIGLTTALAAISGSETAGGFAVPMDTGMRRIIEALRRGEEVEYGFLGIGLRSENRPGKNGVQIGEVTSGSPAQTAGLQPLDTVLAVNGTAVNDNDDLFLALGTLLAGAEARLEVRSAARGPSRIVTVTLAKFYVAGKIIASKKPPLVRGLRVDYTSALMMMQYSSVAGFNSSRTIQAGVFVREVQPDSRAATARVREGEVITHVNGKPVNSPADFYRHTDKLEQSQPLELTLTASEWNKPPPKVTIY